MADIQQSQALPSFMHRDLETILLRAVNESEKILIGETHQVADEIYFIPQMKKLAAAGVTTLAVEINTDQQSTLDYFLRTGRLSKLAQYYQYSKEPELLNLMRAAHRAGIQVVGIDQPFHQRSGNRKSREQYMTQQIEKISGKTLVWVGARHTLFGSKVTSARTLLHEKGIPTAAIKLESYGAAKVINSQPFKRPKEIQSAFINFFGQEGPRKPLACDTVHLGELGFTDLSGSSNLLLYRSAVDYVFFLPNTHSRESTRR